MWNARQSSFREIHDDGEWTKDEQREERDKRRIGYKRRGAKGRKWENDGWHSEMHRCAPQCDMAGSWSDCERSQQYWGEVKRSNFGIISIDRSAPSREISFPWVFQHCATHFCRLISFLTFLKREYTIYWINFKYKIKYKKRINFIHCGFYLLFINKLTYWS